MRRALITASVIAVAGLGSASTASAASYTSCKDINHKIGGKNYKLATKVKVKGISCSDAKAVVVAYTTGGGMLNKSTLEALKARCKPDKKGQAAPTKAGRTATTCASANGKRVLKAWTMNG